MNSKYTPPIPSFERREIRLVTMRVHARITFINGLVLTGLTTVLDDQICDDKEGILYLDDIMFTQ